ncbi:transposase [Carboxylicivirga sp. N1Y90]|uniref:transposase n=1 Tax=Carboxylicivirga fragile TaxID=3417571 RepID=UPI003D3366FA|nr:transposase [Marinilabiliaceae bacterium N1Y90]
MSSIPFEPGAYYHIFNRGNNKENIFKEEKNYKYFLTKMAQHLLNISNVYAYCLMSNHFHLVLEIKKLTELPKEYQSGKKSLHQPFSNMFNAYTKAVNMAYGRTGSLFQEHLKRNVINDENYLLDVITYVHLNPVKHGFNTDFKNYTHSSYQSIVSTGQTQLERNAVIDLFGDKDNFEYCHKAQLYRLRNKLNEIEDIDW